MLNILNIQPISTSRGYIRFFVAVLSLYKKKILGKLIMVTSLAYIVM